MKCKRIREIMGAYLYGDLAPNEMMEVRLHVQGCSECAKDLAERGRVTSAIEDSVPQLSDEERQAVAWSVKGAIRANRQERRSWGFRLVPALGLAAMLILGFGVGAMVGSHSGKSPPPARQAQLDAKPRVKITEQTAEKTEDLQQDQQQLPQEPPQVARRHLEYADEPVPGGGEPRRRSGVRRNRPILQFPVATTRNRHEEDRGKTIVPDEPVPVAPAPPIDGENQGKERLPKPEGLNDAKPTATGQHTQDTPDAPSQP